MKTIITLSPAICLSAVLGLLPAVGFSQDGPPKAVPAPKGAVLRFNFNAKPVDGVVVDSSGKKNNGKVTSASYTTSGKKGAGYLFSSANQMIQVPTKPELAAPKFTLSAWFRVRAPYPLERHIIDNGNLVLGISGVPDNGDITDKDKAFVAFNGRILCYSDYVITDGGWYHLAATFDGAKVRLYLNGKLQCEPVSLKGKFAAGEKDLLLGMVRRPPEASPKTRAVSLGGYLDEVAIYNRPLSETEVKDLALSVDPSTGKAKYTKRQVTGMYAQLKKLYIDGLITDQFLEKKVKQLEAGLGDEEEQAPAQANAKTKGKSKSKSKKK